MRNLTSPFYSRNYGGLSPVQVDFLEPYVKNRRARILDPMSGQAHFLSQLTWAGGHVYIGDINPGPLLLATLRDPRVISRAAGLKNWLAGYLSHRSGRTSDGKPTYSEGWIPAPPARNYRSTRTRLVSTL